MSAVSRLYHGLPTLYLSIFRLVLRCSLGLAIGKFEFYLFAVALRFIVVYL